MKKLIIGVCLLVLISSCGGGKKKIDPFEMLTEEIDSLAAVPDTVEVMEVVEEEPMVPATADESFADFIYNFAIDEKLQVSRIVFPLPYYTMDKKEHIEKKDWKHDPLFRELLSKVVYYSVSLNSGFIVITYKNDLETIIAYHNRNKPFLWALPITFRFNKVKRTVIVPTLLEQPKMTSFVLERIKEKEYTFKQLQESFNLEEYKI